MGKLLLTDLATSNKRTKLDAGKYQVTLKTIAHGTEFIVHTSRFVKSIGNHWLISLKSESDYVGIKYSSLKKAREEIEAFHKSKVAKRFKKHNATIDSFAETTLINESPVIERNVGVSPALAAPYTVDKEMTAHLKQVTSEDLRMLGNFQPTMKKRVAYFLANKNRKQNFEMHVLYVMAGVAYGMKEHIKWRHDAQLVTFEEYDNQFKSMCVILQEGIDTIPNKQNNLFFLNFFLQGVTSTYGPMEARREVDRMLGALHELSVKRACNNQPYASITILIKQCNYIRNRINDAQKARLQGLNSIH